MRNVPYAPGAYNSWLGNQFVIPPLGQYARPVYAEALAPAASNDPALAAAMPQAVDPRIVDHSLAARDGGLGGMPGSAPGVGLNAQAQNAGEFFGSIGRGVGMISNPIGFAMGVLSANRPATWGDLMPGKGLYDAVQAARDYFGGGSDYDAYSGGGGRASTAPETLGGLSEYDMSLATGDTGDPAPGVSSGPTPGDPTQGEGPAFLARGGHVKRHHLAGPNPPGPDDGLAYLDAGEHVINAKQARKHRGLLDAINKGKVSKKKARGLLD